MNKFDAAAQQLHRDLGGLLAEHVSLRDVLDFGIGGVAEFYYKAETLPDLLRATRAASAGNIPWVVIGHGTQSAFSDFGFPGLVIQNVSQTIQRIPGTSQLVLDSGTLWPAIVAYAAGHDLGGAEPYTLFSGSIGGSLATRRGLPGIRLSSIVRHVTVCYPGQDPRRIPLAQVRAALKNGAVLLTVTLQLVQARHDEVLRRLVGYERQRRRYTKPDVRWIGPIFRFEEGFLEWDELFRATRVAGLRSGGAVFSAERPNYIAARGRVSGRDIRELVSQAHAILTDHFGSAPAVALRFIGVWGSDDSSA